MIRLYFKDGSYMDAPDDIARDYENDPEWDHSENLDEKKNYGDDADRDE